jgi:Holliday junction DNA helicase RuvA
MISALTGKLKRVDDDRVFLEAGPMQFELLVPAADVTELQASLGETLTLHTIFMLAGDPSRGGLEPTLIAFLRPEDRQFFELFTTVKGIGAKTALKALTVPVGEIAGAIESKDARFLTRLQGIGKRTAELIVAELSGKVAKFATYAPAGEGGGGGAVAAGAGRRSAVEEDALAVLMQLGERRSDAERLLDRAKATHPDAKSAELLSREMLRLRTVRS